MIWFGCMWLTKTLKHKWLKWKGVFLSLSSHLEAVSPGVVWGLTGSGIQTPYCIAPPCRISIPKIISCPKGCRSPSTLPPGRREDYPKERCMLLRRLPRSPISFWPWLSHMAAPGMLGNVDFYQMATFLVTVDEEQKRTVGWQPAVSATLCEWWALRFSLHHSASDYKMEIIYSRSEFNCKTLNGLKKWVAATLNTAHLIPHFSPRAKVLSLSTFKNIYIYIFKDLKSSYS